MNDKYVIEKAMYYLNRLIKVQLLKSVKEVHEVKAIRESLNGMLYQTPQLRSKDANGYLWYLCTQIANKIRISKEEVYLNMLKNYGQSMKLPIESGKSPYGFTKYYEFITTSTLNGKKADWYIFYKGSSNYTQKEMSILLDGVIQEANQLDIPTLSDEQVEKMKGNWINEEEEKNIKK